MTEVISDNTIQKVTGTSWHVWMERMDKMGAADLSHKAIVTNLMTTYAVDGWWAQSLTVRYERVTGRRAAGQNNDGLYTASVTKTIDGTMDQALQWWLQKTNQLDSFDDVEIISSSNTKTDKWRYYRAALADDTRVVVGIYQKSATKAGIGLAHEKVTSAQAADDWRTYWKSFLSSEK